METRITYPEPGVGQLPAIANLWASERRLVTAFCDKEAGVREVGALSEDGHSGTCLLAVE